MNECFSFITPNIQAPGQKFNYNYVAYNIMCNIIINTTIIVTVYWVILKFIVV